MTYTGLQTAVTVLYPPRCLTCGTVVDSDFGLCGPCWRDTTIIGGAICDCCGVPIPGSEATDTPHCDSCMQSPRPWTQGRSALVYRANGRKMVLALKHGDRQEIAKPAALLMARSLRGLLPKNTLVAPVPLHWLRLIKRRYNQSALLGKELSKQMGLAFCPDLLQRFRRTDVLDGLGIEDRFAMLENAIRPHPRRLHRMAGRPVLLVDDVMTSGATLSAATQVCLDAGSGPVRVVTLARATKDA